MLEHDWNVSIAQAKAIQQRLSQKITLQDDFGDIRHVAGTDVSIGRSKKFAYGVVVVLSFPELEIVDRVCARLPLEFPYVPGYLSFREAPALLDAYAKLSIMPNLLLCDGQGIAHPRRFGIACHLGLLTDTPAIGIAKSRLIGTHQAPGPDKGSAVALYHNNQQIGNVLRSRKSVSPIYVSPGHKISCESALRFALQCCRKYRLPETTRQAHRFATNVAKQRTTNLDA